MAAATQTPGLGRAVAVAVLPAARRSAPATCRARRGGAVVVHSRYWQPDRDSPGRRQRIAAAGRTNTPRVCSTATNTIDLDTEIHAAPSRRIRLRCLRSR